MTEEPGELSPTVSPYDPLAPLVSGRTLVMNNRLRAQMLCELAAGLAPDRRRVLARAIEDHLQWAQREALARRRVSDSTYIVLPPS